MRNSFRPQLIAGNAAPPKAEVPDVMPETPEQLAEFLADDDRMAAIFGNEGTRSEFLAKYNQLTNNGDHIANQVAEQAAATVMDFLKETGATNRPDMTDVADRMTAQVVSEIHRANLAEQPVTVYNPRAMGSSIDNEYTTAGDYFKAIWHNANQYDPDIARRRNAFKNAFTEKVPSEGGFLVPERLRSELLRVSLENSVVRPRARVIPMDSLRVPFPAIDATSNASSVYGGIVGYWTEEGATLTESTPAFRRLVLEAKKHTAYAEVPNELLSDSIISFEAFIGQIFPEALAWWEDVAFFDGSGAGEPKGFLNADAAISVTKESGQAADTVVWENIVKAYSRMLPASLGRAVWVVNHDVFPELATMALSVGTGGSAIWLNNGSEGPPMTILGRPVITTEKAETLGDAGDVNFVDFGYYLIGDRQVMSARSSEDFKFQNDQTAFRIIQRLDGTPWLNSALTPHKSSTTLSPFVKIAARA